MSTITTIGCKLPHGPCMEIGVGKNQMPAADYRCAIILGVQDVSPRLLVGPKEAQYAITRVPKEIADEWFKVNATSRYVLEKAIFIIK